ETLHKERLAIVRHHFVRMFGRILNELYAEAWTKSGNESMAKAGQALHSLKRDLEHAFLRDTSENPTGKLSATKIYGLKSSLGSRFSDELFAEAFDSYFCHRYGEDAANTRIT